MNDPIGILDSGSGGLSIWKEIASLLPNESTIYIGDHKHMPYSQKSTAYIRDRALRLIRFLLDNHAKIIVIACNTATVAGIDIYRKKFSDIPIIGVVPVIKTAATMSKTKHIAILSTKYTSESVYQDELIKTFASDCNVLNIGSTRLVALIEEGASKQSEINKELVSLLNPLKNFLIDVLVLGCTHFPLVRDNIRAIVGSSVEILDSGEAVARQTKRILEKEHRLNSGPANYVFHTTGNYDDVSIIASHLMGKSITMKYANI